MMTIKIMMKAAALTTPHSRAMTLVSVVVAPVYRVSLSSRIRRNTRKKRKSSR